MSWEVTSNGAIIDSICIYIVFYYSVFVCHGMLYTLVHKVFMYAYVHDSLVGYVYTMVHNVHCQMHSLCMLMSTAM